MSDGIILVTGGAGFIGSNIVAMLAAEGKSVVVCDRFHRDEQWRYLSPFLIHDLVAPEVLLDWLTSHAADVTEIIHMGAISATTASNTPRIIRDNVRFTLDLWDYASAHEATFIYASSAATYGNGAAGFVDDDTPEGLARLRPLNLYGWSKHFVDRRFVNDHVQGRPTPPKWAGLKFFNVYGPNEAHKGAMRSVVHQIYPKVLRGEPVRLFKSARPDYPDGGQLRDFVYVKDCCEIVRNILLHQDVTGIFNAGTGRARTFAELAAAVFRAVGREPAIDYIDMPADLARNYQYFTEADITKLTAAGLSPPFHALESGVADYVDSHLLHEFAG